MFRLFLSWTDFCKGIGLGRRAQIFAVHVGINLGGIQILVAQHLLECAHIHAILQH